MNTELSTSRQKAQSKTETVTVAHKLSAAE